MCCRLIADLTVKVAHYESLLSATQCEALLPRNPCILLLTLPWLVRIARGHHPTGYAYLKRVTSKKSPLAPHYRQLHRSQILL